MANDALAAWGVKFLAALTAIDKETGAYRKALALNSKGGTGRASTSDLVKAGQKLLAVRAELSALFAASADFSPAIATSILTPLDTLLAPIGDGSWLNNIGMVGPKTFKGTGALSDWYKQYIKPFI